MSVTRDSSYFEAFAVGDVFHHRRARTLSQADNAHWSLATLNTAQAHWNIESMKTYMGGAFEQPIMNAAIVLALAIGLTSQDMSENSVAELALDHLRMQRPTFPGDTLSATSTVVNLGEHDGDPRCGRMDYAIEVKNQRGDTACTLVRSVLLKRRAHWEPLDRSYAARHWPGERA